MFSDFKLTVPIVSILKTYQKAWVRRDLIAGITVAAVAIPQAMAYAQLAGAPLIAGLYAALLAMIVFAIFSTTRLVIVGPDAAMAALTGATLIPLTLGDPSRYAALVAVLAILIGLACLVAVFARLGFIAEFLSRPILLGYMAGLALAVIASQLPKIFGFAVPIAGNFFTTCTYILTHLSETSLATLCLGLTLIVVSLLLQKYTPKIPSSLVILILSSLVSSVFAFSSNGIAVVGEIPRGLPLPQWPVITFFDLQNLIVPALAIMVVSYANTIATARSFTNGQKETIDAPQEFVGLGLSNIASGVFGGIPVAASGARTAVNKDTRAVTQVSQLFGALSIGIVLVFLAPLLHDLPLAALAVIIIMAVQKLFNYRELKSIWHAWRLEAILAVITLFGVTLLGIFQGLLLAVLLAMALLVRNSAFPHDAVLGLTAEKSLRDMSRPPKTEAIPGMIIYRFDAPLFFGNANFFRERVNRLIYESKEPVKWFLWDAETITSLDSTGAQMLRNLIRDLKSRDITFAIARLKGPVRHTINKSRRLSYTFQNTPHFTSMGDALEAYENEYKRDKDQENNIKKRSHD